MSRREMQAPFRIVVVLVVLAASAAAGRSSGAPGSFACTPSLDTIKGVMVTVSCGPAKASVTYQGKTYTFKVGRCHMIGGGFFVNIGRSAALGDKPPAYAFDVGVPSFPKPHGGTYTETVTLAWQIPGRRFQLKAPYEITLSNKLKKGTFSGPVIGLPGKAKGSWTC